MKRLTRLICPVHVKLVFMARLIALILFAGGAMSARGQTNPYLPSGAEIRSMFDLTGDFSANKQASTAVYSDLSDGKQLNITWSTGTPSVNETFTRIATAQQFPDNNGDGDGGDLEAFDGVAWRFLSDTAIKVKPFSQSWGNYNFQEGSQASTGCGVGMICVPANTPTTVSINWNTVTGSFPADDRTNVYRIGFQIFGPSPAQNGTTRQSMVSITTLLPLAPFNIFQWEYNDPSNHSLGKQESTVLTADGYGLHAQPGLDASSKNLTMAYLHGADLTGANFSYANLTDADLSQANLTGGNFIGANLTGVDFADADVRGASVLGIALAELYSTASYKIRDLNHIDLRNTNLTGANLADQNLAGANFIWAELAGADLSGADVRGASFTRDGYYNVGGLSLSQLYSTASYQSHDLTGIVLGFNGLNEANFAGQNLTSANLSDTALNYANFQQANLTNATLQAAYLSNANFHQANLTGAAVSGVLTRADFSRANLTDADLYSANLTGANLDQANFTGAKVAGGNFASTGITLDQLYSTASYQAHDMTGIGLLGSDLTGAQLRRPAPRVSELL